MSQGQGRVSLICPSGELQGCEWRARSHSTCVSGKVYSEEGYFKTLEKPADLEVQLRQFGEFYYIFITL